MSPPFGIAARIGPRSEAPAPRPRAPADVDPLPLLPLARSRGLRRRIQSPRAGAMPPKRPKGPDRGLMIAHKDAIKMLDGPLAKTMEVRGDLLPGTVADRGSLEMNDRSQRFHVFTFPVTLYEVRRAVGDYSLGGIYIKALATGRIVEQFSFANDPETYMSYIGEHRTFPHELPANLQSKRSLVAWKWADIVPLQTPFYIDKRGRQNWVYFDLRSDVIRPPAGAPFQAPLGGNRALQARVRQLRANNAIHCCDKHGLLSDFLHWPEDIREIAHASRHSYARAIIAEGRRNIIACSKERSRSRGLPAADGAAAAEK